jgi:DNA replication protein DnaC
MSDAARTAVIQEHCKELELAAVVRDYPALCRQARDGGWAYEDLLRELLEAEVTNRRQSTARRLLREARFPDVKTLDQIVWAALKGVARPKILELSSCDFISRAEDVILAGPIGTGKTMLGIALGGRGHAPAVSRALHPRRRSGAEPDRGPRRTAPHRAAAALSESRASSGV